MFKTSSSCSSQKSNRVNWAPDSILCQVKLFLSEDSPSQVSCKTEDLQPKASWMSHSSGVGFDNPPPGFGGNRYPPSPKESCIPQIKWRCPPRLILRGDWHVAAGEHSQETETQANRELSVLEALYPRLSAIPPSPTMSPASEECDYDDNKTPLIPVTPIEEEDPVDQDLVTMASSQHNVPVNTSTPVGHISLGTPTGRATDVAAAAASAAFSAIMKASENGSMIDTDLLIKILNDPKVMEKLPKQFGGPANAGVLDSKPQEENIRMNSTVPKLQPSSNSFPNSQAISNINTHSSFVSEVPFQSLPISETHASFSKNLDGLNQPFQNPLLTPSTSLDFRSKMAIPSVPYSVSEPDKIIPRTVNEENFPKTFPPSSNTFSLGMAAPTPAEVFSRSEDLSASHGQETVSSAMPGNQRQHPEMHLMNRPIQAPSPQPNRLAVPSLSSADTSVVKDISYYKNLVKLHGEERAETEEKHTPAFSSGGPGQGSRSSARKPCKYFNSSAGCRKGSGCPYQHDSQMQTGGISDISSNKRIRLSR